MTPGLIQIYEMSNASAQQRAFDVLDDMDGVIATQADNGPDHFVLVEVADRSQAQGVYTALRSVDPELLLLETADLPGAGIEHLMSAADIRAAPPES